MPAPNIDLDFLHDMIKDHADRDERAQARMEQRLDGFEVRVMQRLSDIEAGYNKRSDDAEAALEETTKLARLVEKKVEHHENTFKTVLFLLMGGMAAISGCFEQIRHWLTGAK